MSFCSCYFIFVYVFEDCISASVLEKRCGGNKLFRVQLGVRLSRQKVDDDSQREEAAVCSPSAEISSIHVTERNGGYFNQQAAFERCPTAGDSFKTYCFYMSVGLEMIPIGTEGAAKKCSGFFNFTTVELIIHDSFI